MSRTPQRYDRAEEFADVVLGLWDSFDDDAFLRDKIDGPRSSIPPSFTSLNHKGKHFAVRGPLSVARPPQGHPVLIQAGKSEPAREVSARVADCRLHLADLARGRAGFYADVKGRLAKYGRSPDDLKIMPGVAVFTGRTAAEAEEKYERLHALIDPAAALALLKERLGGIDLSGHPLDGPVPEMQGNDVRHEQPAGARAPRAAREPVDPPARLPLRRGAQPLDDPRLSAKDVADRLEEWFVGKAADGFNLLPQYLPGCARRLRRARRSRAAAPRPLPDGVSRPHAPRPSRPQAPAKPLRQGPPAGLTGRRTGPMYVKDGRARVPLLSG